MRTGAMGTTVTTIEKLITSSSAGGGAGPREVGHLRRRLHRLRHYFPAARQRPAPSTRDASAH